MNPFTRSLLHRNTNVSLQTFVARWDALEALVIRVYRNGTASTADCDEHRALRPLLLLDYQRWREPLRPCWRAARCGSKPCEEDPFEFLLRVETPARFVGSWEHMQALPAAREALNRLLLETQP